MPERVGEGASIEPRTSVEKIASWLRWGPKVDEGLVRAFERRFGGFRVVEQQPSTEGEREPGRPPTERNALLSVERAARELDAFFDPKNKGQDHEGRWVFDGRRVSFEASQSLLSLHDYLNDVEAARDLPESPEHQPDDEGHQRFQTDGTGGQGA